MFAGPLERRLQDAYPCTAAVDRRLHPPGCAATGAPGACEVFGRAGCAEASSTSGGQGRGCRSAAVKPLRLVACGGAWEGNKSMETSWQAVTFKRKGALYLNSMCLLNANVCLYRGRGGARGTRVTRANVGCPLCGLVYLCYALS